MKKDLKQKLKAGTVVGDVLVNVELLKIKNPLLKQ